MIQTPANRREVVHHTTGRPLGAPTGRWAAGGLLILLLLPLLCGCRKANDESHSAAPPLDASPAPGVIAEELDAPDSPVPAPPPPPSVVLSPTAEETFEAPRMMRSLEMDSTKSFQRGTPEMAYESQSMLDESSPPMQIAMAPESPEHLEHLPPGAEHREAEGYTVVPVFYGTDRERSPVPLSGYRLGGDPKTLAVMLGGLLLTVFVATAFALRGRRGSALLGMGTALVWGGAVALLVHQGRAAIEKEGVTYTGGRGELVRGLCEVTIPDTHQRGEVERPQLLRLELSEDLRRHVVLKRARELPAPEFFRQLAEAVESAEHRDLFVFIHGYNVDFDSAVRRTAQIAVDLPFRGVPVCYSWPSQASLLGYKVDENNVNWTISHLKQFLLELVAYADADSINLVAHSMGNRALTAALRELSLEMGEAAGMFDRLVLAAPDIDADHFRRDLAPHLLNAARHVTLYASSGDRALIASKQVHGYPRAGESGPGIVVVPGVETIDVSGIDLSLLGHSYYGDSQDLLHDLFHIVREAMPAAQRSWLLRREKGPLEYWQLSSSAGPTGPNLSR